MNEWLDAGDLAGMSATLAYWLLIGTAGMGSLLWKYRGRFSGWWRQTPGQRADTILNIGLFGFLAYATFQRSIATYAFAASEWKASEFTLTIAPPNMAWAMVFVACILWWMCFFLFGPPNSWTWWIVFILTGFWLGASISARY